MKRGFSVCNEELAIYNLQFLIFDEGFAVLNFLTFNLKQMKHKGSIILLAAMILIFNNLSAQEKNDSITQTFQTAKRRIVVAEAGKEVKVKVFNRTDSSEMQAIYEGTFVDGKEYEKYTVNHALDWGIELFSKKKKKKRRCRRSYPHWNGIGWGFTTVTDGVRFNNIDNVSLKTELSNEFFINLTEIPFTLYRNNLMIYTGFGISWKNFHLKGNTCFAEKEGVTVVQLAPSDISYKKSRLRVFSVNIPLALEFQAGRALGHQFYISAGVIGGFNLFRSQKLKYKDTNGKKVKQYDKGLNVARVSFEFMAQVGVDAVGIFAKYSPMSLFENDEGPNVQTASLGLFFSF